MTRYRLTFPEPQYDGVRGHLLQGAREEVALLFAHEMTTAETTGLIVRRWEPVPPAMLLRQDEDAFVVDSQFIVSRVKQARGRGESILLAHSHPGERAAPRFSRADDRGEDDLYPLLQVRIPGRIHGAVVMSPGGQAARLRLPDGTRVPVEEVRVVGRRVQRCFGSSRDEQGGIDEARARQRLIWGARGQGMLRDATAGIVGAGGTGSVVAQQLIHLGIGRIIAIDPQVVAESNVSRIVGVRREDIDVTPKVAIVARTARAVDPDIDVRPIRGDVTQPEVLSALKAADVLFVCTDSHHSRAVVNALAVQYAIPLVDLGFLIDVEPETHKVISAVGEVRIVVPGGYCLSCAGVLDADRIKAEKASPEERAANPGYFTRLDVDDPAVITLNSTIASLAVTVGGDMLVPTMRPVSALDSYRYNAVKGLVANVQKHRQPACGICGDEGRAAMGATLPLPR
ncbi:MAG TPA: ThiF family adenylyltransferase [Thermomicrobiales bacterium]|nr:ThiF family adenylyltransferase [Thermomicrobiales bacterium]